jgi:3-oxoadipate enol-lactonase
MPTMATPTSSIYYERAGSGPPLLVVNGTGSDLRNRPNIMDGPLQADFDVVGYDHRGLGRSQSPVEPPSMADYAADAVALVDHLGWDDFLLFGISFGGMVAQEVALLAGGRVRRLVLACTSAGGDGGSSYPLHELFELEEAERITRQIELLDTRCNDDPQMVSMFREHMPNVAVTPGLMLQLEARRHHDTWDRLPSIVAPTLVAAGRFDGIAPLVNSEALSHQIPNAELRVFDGGHAFFLQDPAALPEIARFLGA